MRTLAIALRSVPPGARWSRGSIECQVVRALQGSISKGRCKVAITGPAGLEVVLSVERFGNWCSERSGLIAPAQGAALT